MPEGGAPACIPLMGVKNPPVVQTPEEYVQQAVALMRDSTRRADLRQEIFVSPRARLCDRLDDERSFESLTCEAVASARVACVRYQDAVNDQAHRP